MALTFRANYTISPNLSFQSYAEPFISTGDYQRYREVTDGRADRHDDRYAPYAYADNANFNFRSFRTTNVLRWEYKPGSALFVVFNQGRQERLEGDFGDFRRRPRRRRAVQHAGAQRLPGEVQPVVQFLRPNAASG